MIGPQRQAEEEPAPLPLDFSPPARGPRAASQRLQLADGAVPRIAPGVVGGTRGDSPGDAGSPPYQRKVGQDSGFVALPGMVLTFDNIACPLLRA
jgi:hypothetical protein